jgi:ribosomal protein S18 acetylase RimI-like enzyme
MRITFDTATARDAEALCELRNSTADRLTEEFGRGYWSGHGTTKGILFGLRNGQAIVARRGKTIVGTLRLAIKKPWALDRAYFAKVRRPLYLVDMAVAIEFQRQGVGRKCMAHAEKIAHAWPAQAIWLDAWDAPAGAGGFYKSCGYMEVGRVTFKGAPLVYFEKLF